MPNTFPNDPPDVPEVSVPLLELLLDTAPVGFAFIDRRIRFARVSDKFAEISGIPPRDHVGKPVADVIGGDLWNRVSPLLEKALAGEPTYDFELEAHSAIRPETLSYFLTSYYPVRLGGTVIGVGALVIDITDMKQAQAMARESDRQIQSVLESVSDGFVSFDRNLRYRYVNAAAETLLNKPRNEMLGRRWPDIFPLGIHTPFYAALIQALETQQPTTVIQKAPTLASWIESRIFPSGDTIAVYFRDVTLEREEEMRLRTFVKDMLSSVTGGRFILCHSPADLPAPRPEDGGSYDFTRASGLHGLRDLVARAAEQSALPDERVMDLLTAVSEAGMNAIVHGGEAGHATVTYDAAEGIVQARIVDGGAGISIEHLPKAAFREGYTTAGTMGFGFKLILQTADCVWLLTSATGTTLVLEQKRTAPSIAWA